MTDAALLKRWKVIEALLRRARSSALVADPSVAQELDQFDDYLEHNELGLALDELSAIVEGRPCRGRFWRSMERAALIMGEAEKAREFKRRFAAVLAGPR